ncbi:MAG: TonB family protein [Acidobacteriota bacterium]
MAKKVLLIDYEPRSVERVRSLLAEPDYSVTVAKDGEEGIALFGASSFDTVLLAGMLPRLPSAEVIREIRRKGGATAPPILLMVSGYHGTNPKADAQRVGAFDIVPRPYTDDDFRAAVQSAVESTDMSARTMRIPTASLRGGGSSLTSEEIFSDILDEVSHDPPPRPATSHGGGGSAEQEVERRLRDTLSGILSKGGGAEKPAAPPPPAGARFSTDADIDRMISDTLSGIKVPPKPRPAAPSAPSPATPPSSASLTPPRAVPPSSAPFQSAYSPAAAVATPPPFSGGRTSPSGSTRAPETAPSLASSGPDRFGQYEILERIAAGGMAELSKARLSGVEGFQKIVAIKKILPHLADNDEFITMFADEAKLAAQLNHPNIVHIFDLGKIEAGGYFIAMEYVDGRDLRSLLQSARDHGTPLPAPLAVYVASKVAAALDYAHRRRDSEARELNIVHRDVSPPNILISYEGDIKLCDFGIAKAASKASQTQSGALKGKVQYMSPEQAWGRPLDRRSDLFSLGSVLFEMLTEQKLFRGDTDLSVLEKVRAAEVVPPSSINPEVTKALDVVVLKALAREPEDRYANASDMLRDLEAVLYSYSPAPGSADLAIYLHRLQAEEVNAQESQAREAAPMPEAPEKKRKSKGAPVARRATAPGVVIPPAVPLPPAPKAKEPTNSGVFGAFSAKKIAAEKKNRLPLYIAIAVAVAALAGVAWWMSKRAPVAAAPVKATPLPLAAPTAAPPPPAATPAAAPADPRAIEEEVQRQISARKKELQKALEAPKPSPREAIPARKIEEPPPAAAVPVKETAPEPTAAPTVREAPPEPTVAPAPPPRPAPNRDETLRGDLVGPGTGVIEPALLSTPRVTYPPIARQQRLSGKVVVLVLVDEDGKVEDARLQHGIASKTGVNEAVVQAVRGSKFRAASKNGVAVKMWRTVVVDVTP